jgi:hypothetical protein
MKYAPVDLSDFFYYLKKFINLSKEILKKLKIVIDNYRYLK